MAVITKVELEAASVDAQSLEDVVNGAADLSNPGHEDGTVTSRLGRVLKTIARIEEDVTEQVDAAIVTASRFADLKTVWPLTDDGHEHVSPWINQDGLQAVMVRSTVGDIVRKGERFSVAANKFRVGDLGVLLEPFTTNFFLNSDTPIDQVVAGIEGSGRVYCAWFDGTGTMTVTAGTVVSSELPATVGPNVPLQFIATQVPSGTISVTFSGGTPTFCQVELYDKITSRIHTTGTAVQRYGDVMTVDVPFSSGQHKWCMEAIVTPSAGTGLWQNRAKGHIFQLPYNATEGAVGLYFIRHDYGGGYYEDRRINCLIYNPGAGIGSTAFWHFSDYGNGMGPGAGLQPDGTPYDWRPVDAGTSHRVSLCCENGVISWFLDAIQIPCHHTLQGSEIRNWLSLYIGGKDMETFPMYVKNLTLSSEAMPATGKPRFDTYWIGDSQVTPSRLHEALDRGVSNIGYQPTHTSAAYGGSQFGSALFEAASQVWKYIGSTWTACPRWRSLSSYHLAIVGYGHNDINLTVENFRRCLDKVVSLLVTSGVKQILIMNPNPSSSGAVWEDPETDAGAKFLGVHEVVAAKWNVDFFDVYHLFQGLLGQYTVAQLMSDSMHPSCQWNSPGTTERIPPIVAAIQSPSVPDNEAVAEITGGVEVYLGGVPTGTWTLDAICELLGNDWPELPLYRIAQQRNRYNHSSTVADKLVFPTRSFTMLHLVTPGQHAEEGNATSCDVIIDKALPGELIVHVDILGGFHTQLVAMDLASGNHTVEVVVTQAAKTKIIGVVYTGVPAGS